MAETLKFHAASVVCEEKHIYWILFRGWQRTGFRERIAQLCAEKQAIWGLLMKKMSKNIIFYLHYL